MENVTGKTHLGWSVSSAHHLQDVCDRVVVIGVELAIVVLGVHDDDKVGLDGKGPCQGPGRHHHLDIDQSEHSFYKTNQSQITWMAPLSNRLSTSLLSPGVRPSCI